MSLGTTVIDRITGFQGVVTAHATYLSGCHQTLVQPRTKDGAWVEPQWFDDQRLDTVSAPIITLDNGATPGCDRPAPKR